MGRLGAVTAVVWTLAVCACSDRSAPSEAVAPAALPLIPRFETQPLLGPGEAGWRLAPAADFNFDGMQDVIWRNHTANQITVALMSGTQRLELGPTIAGPPHPDWVVLSGQGDFNLDGMADILWYNPTTNRITVWLMRGTEPFEKGREIPGPSGNGWICVPASDFNFDGMADVLWYNPTTNRMSVWLMHGTEPFERGAEFTGLPGGTWLADFAADFDQDGMADVFWDDRTTNRVAIWLMNGTTPREQGPPIPGPPGKGWILTGAGDFNRDHVVDELWYNPRTQRMTISLMWGTGLLEQGPEIPGPPGAGWIVGNAVDCNGDGMTDVLWLNTSPLEMRVWLMDGTTPMVMGPSIPGPG